MSVHGHTERPPGGSEEKLTSPCTHAPLLKAPRAREGESSLRDPGAAAWQSPLPPAGPLGAVAVPQCHRASGFLREEGNSHQRPGTAGGLLSAPGLWGCGERHRRPSFLLAMLCPPPQHRRHLGCGAVPCRMLSSIPAFYPLDAGGTRPSLTVTARDGSSTANCTPG